MKAREMNDKLHNAVEQVGSVAMKLAECNGITESHIKEIEKSIRSFIESLGHVLKTDGRLTLLLYQILSNRVVKKMSDEYADVSSSMGDVLKNAKRKKK